MYLNSILIADSSQEKKRNFKKKEKKNLALRLSRKREGKKELKQESKKYIRIKKNKRNTGKLKPNNTLENRNE